MSEQIPEFYSVVDKSISNIAKKRGENPEEFKESLLRKIRKEQEQCSK
jgi:hypothetical protein